MKNLINLILLLYVFARNGEAGISFSQSGSNGYKLYKDQVNWLPKGNVLPISHNTYFQAFSDQSQPSECASARDIQPEEHDEIKREGNLGSRDPSLINKYYGINLQKGEMNKFRDVKVSNNTATFDVSNSHLAEMAQMEYMIKMGFLSSDMSGLSLNDTCLINKTCMHDYRKYIEEYKSYNKVPISNVEETRDYNNVKFERADCDRQCGRGTQTVDFSMAVGDVIAFTHFMNGTNQYVLTDEQPMTLRLKSLNVTYPLIDCETYGTDIEIETNCFCHCPFGLSSSSCHSGYDGCDGHEICSNNYIGGQNDWSCALNIGYDSSTCCTGYVKSYNKYKACEVGSPQGVTAVIEYCTAFFQYNVDTCTSGGQREIDDRDACCPAGTCWRGICYDVVASFGNVQQFFSADTGAAYSYSCAGQNSIGLEMTAVGDLIGYQGGDRLMDLSDDDQVAKVVTGWNDEYSSDVSKPGWLRFKESTMVYNKNSFHDNIQVELKNCAKDEFKITDTVDRSSTEALPTVHDLLSQWGDHTVDWTNKLITINPERMDSALFRFTAKNLMSIDYHTGKLGGFNCTRILPLSSVILSCKLQNYAGGSICFILKTKDGVQLGISCGAPSMTREDIAVVTLSFTIGMLTQNGQLCAQGYDQVQCSTVNITTTTFNQFNNSWVGTYTKSFSSNDKEQPVDYDFGDSSTWFEDLESSVYPILTLIAIVLGFLLFCGLMIVLIWFFRPMLKYIRNTIKKRAAMKRLEKIKSEEELEELETKPSNFIYGDDATIFVPKDSTQKMIKAYESQGLILS